MLGNSGAWSGLAAATVLLGALTAFRPRLALVLLFAALPLFVHQPHSPWALRLFVLVGVVELVYLLSSRTVWRDLGTQASRRPLLFLAALFTITSLLSLSSLPLGAIAAQHAQVLRTSTAPAWPGYLAALLTLQEFTVEYSITSALLTLQGFLLALIVWRETRMSPGTAIALCGALTTGLAAFVVLGLLDLSGHVNLNPVRGTVGVFPRPGTVQSFAGNPGWYAEYVVYALPFALVLLTGRARWGLRSFVLAGFAALSALSLVLCFQRGGWLAGIVVLAYMGAAASRVAAPAARARRRPIVRAAAVVLVLAVTVGAASLWFMRTGAGSGLSGADYASRFRSIARADRLAYARAGLMIGALHPVMGGSVESFAYRYRLYFREDAGPYRGSAVSVPEATSAHSLYFQTLTGMGLVGLVLLLSMFAYAWWAALRSLRSAPIAQQGGPETASADGAARRVRTVIVLAAAGSLVGFAAYGLVQEVFYVHALRLLFFVAIGLTAAAAQTPAWTRRVRTSLLLALVTAFILHLVVERVYPGPERLLRAGEASGFFGEERSAEGVSFRWTTHAATLPVPARADTLVMEVRSVAPFAQHVRVTGCDGPSVELHLPDHPWHDLSAALEDCDAGSRARIEVRPPWRPPGEERLLGVMVRGIQTR
ncbi:MAG TPA: O-antigen ligase family protein [Vicinamibacterales bacterium]|nr:O-antigen ligase family protein [Vicinamibacterales bacterium]